MVIPMPPVQAGAGLPAQGGEQRQFVRRRVGFVLDEGAVALAVGQRHAGQPALPHAGDPRVATVTGPFSDKRSTWPSKPLVTIRPQALRRGPQVAAD